MQAITSTKAVIKLIINPYALTGWKQTSMHSSTVKLLNRFNTE